VLWVTVCVKTRTRVVVSFGRNTDGCDKSAMHSSQHNVADSERELFLITLPRPPQGIAAVGESFDFVTLTSLLSALDWTIAILLSWGCSQGR
jgi:hypothetical protein